MTRAELSDYVDALDAQILRVRRLPPEVRARLPADFAKGLEAAVSGGCAVLRFAPEGHETYSRPDLLRIRDALTLARNVIDRAIAEEARAVAARGLLN